MVFAGYLSNLKTKHDTIEAAIQEELKRPVPNVDAIRDLKKAKLRIKEEILRYNRPFH